MKCLEREPSDCDASADDLASDLRCYLADTAIATRPHTLCNPARKFHPKRNGSKTTLSTVDGLHFDQIEHCKR